MQVNWVEFLLVSSFTLRPYSWLLLIAGAVIMLPVFLVGFEKLREKTGGPMGEVLLGLGLLSQGLMVASWWLPAYLR